MTSIDHLPLAVAGSPTAGMAAVTAAAAAGKARRPGDGPFGPQGVVCPLVASPVDGPTDSRMVQT